MNFFENFNPKISSILKITGIAVAGIVVLAIMLRFIGMSVNTFLPGMNSKVATKSMGNYSFGGAATQEAAMDNDGVASLSLRNAKTSKMPISPTPESIATGDTSEAYEITEYNANIETRDIEKSCQDVASLKARTDVIFENSNEYDKGCNYRFKVKQASAKEILEIIKGMDPKSIDENIYTIKGQIDDYTSEADILKKKLISIDETLKNAVNAYDEITKMATNLKDVESLAKIIDSKINIIERLTQERININSQLESIERSKSEQLDRLEYTYFNVNIYENKYIDGEDLRDSWKLTVKQFVNDVNSIFQDLSVNLVTLIMKILQFALYLLIILVVAKYGWKLGRYIWKK